MYQKKSMHPKQPPRLSKHKHASTENPITNVSAFNSSKTKSVLSNKDGIVNLSRFLSNDTIFIQHPSYALKKLIKFTLVTSFF